MVGGGKYLSGILDNYSGGGECKQIPSYSSINFLDFISIIMAQTEWIPQEID